MKELNLKIELTDKQFDLLTELKKEGYAEYRDNHETLEDFLNSDDYKVNKRTEEWFMSRNFNGTYNTMVELSNLELVEHDGMAWHETFILSDLGKKVLEQNGLF